MLALDQIIVTLWFLPVVIFIVLPLIVTSIGLLCRLLAAFKPFAGQAGSRATSTS